MPPVTNKRHQMIINNLKSIMAEIRHKSLIQLSELPEIAVSTEEKVKYYREALEDSEEVVKSTAKRLLQATGASMEPGTAPATTSRATPPVATPPQAPPDTPSSGNTFGPEGSDSGLNDFGLLSPAKGEPVSRRLPDGTFTTEPPAVPGFQIEAPPLEEPIDPALPAIQSLKAIPQKLEHIRFLARNRPGGHLTHLLALARDEIEEVALTALQTLLNIRDPRTPPQVLVFFSLPSFSSQRRFLVLKIIMETSASLETPALEHILLTEKDVIVKSGLVKVFARIAKDEGVKTLKLCLFDPDPRVRANTVEVIEEQGIHGCEAEITRLLQDPENRVKVNAAKFLVKSGYTQAFQTLKTMLGSSEVWLRDSVIFALGEIGDQPSLTLLKAALKDPNQGIRLSVLKSLAKINNTPARDALQGSVDDPDPVVAQVARGLWEKIKNLPVRPPSPPAVTPPPLPQMPSSEAAPVVPSRPAAPAVPPAPVRAPAPPPPEVPAEEAEVAPIAPPKPAAPIAPKAPAEPGAGFSLPTLDPGEETSPASAAPATRPAAKPTAPVPPPRPTAPPPSTGSVAPRPAMPSASPRPATPATATAGQPTPLPRPGTPATPPKPPAAPQATVVLPPGSPTFQKPRSAEVYLRLLNGTPTDLEAAMKDLPFILGDDQMALLQIAATHENENVRLNAAKILSRKKGPPVVALLQTLAADSNSLVSSVASKALTLLK